MSKKLHRKSISNSFKIKGHLCKVILDPWCKLENGFYNWNVGFAVGKSNRQINDWYHKRKNRRARSLKNKLTGAVGIKAIGEGWRRVLQMRWHIQPGDSVTITCTSAKPEQQFIAFQYWRRYHCDWLYDSKNLEFHWTRPPYPDDTIWQKYKFIAKVPDDPLKPIHPGAYFDCFTLL